MLKKRTDHFRRVKFEVVGDEDGPEELHAELPDEAPNLLQRRRLKRRQNVVITSSRRSTLIPTRSLIWLLVTKIANYDLAETGLV